MQMSYELPNDDLSQAAALVRRVHSDVSDLEG